MKVYKYYKNNLIKYGLNHHITNITNFSKEASYNTVFYDEIGSYENIKDAINKGCVSIVINKDMKFTNDLVNYNLNIIKVENVKKTYTNDLYNLNKRLFKHIKVITITGTNGKTTVSTLLYKFLLQNGKNVLLIGSNGNYLNERYYQTKNTTCDIRITYDLMKKLKKGYVIIEASSHGIKNLRLNCIPITLSLFTNLTLDHLDFHKTFDDYKYTKLLHLINSKFAILNSDDPTYPLYSNYIKNYYSIGRSKSNYNDCGAYNYKIKQLSLNHNTFEIFDTITHKKWEINTNLNSTFNITNLVYCYSALRYLGYKDYKIVSYLNQKHYIIGRLNEIDYHGIRVFVDFCHTPDGVKQVLEYFSKIKKNNKIYTVIGCGGSKDRIKRAIIGEVCLDLSDYVFFTSDNPRSEDPLDIIREILKTSTKTNYEIEENRKIAIDKALKKANINDYVLILGKGNENEILYKDYSIKHNDLSYVKSKL